MNNDADTRRQAPIPRGMVSENLDMQPALSPIKTTIKTQYKTYTHSVYFVNCSLASKFNECNVSFTE